MTSASVPDALGPGEDFYWRMCFHAHVPLVPSAHDRGFSSSRGIHLLPRWFQQSSAQLLLGLHHCFVQCPDFYKLPPDQHPNGDGDDGEKKNDDGLPDDPNPNSNSTSSGSPSRLSPTGFPSLSPQAGGVVGWKDARGSLGVAPFLALVGTGVFGEATLPGTRAHGYI